jgi:hypothetical protein
LDFYSPVANCVSHCSFDSININTNICLSLWIALPPEEIAVPWEHHHSQPRLSRQPSSQLLSVLDTVTVEATGETNTAGAIALGAHLSSCCSRLQSLVFVPHCRGSSGLLTMHPKPTAHQEDAKEPYHKSFSDDTISISIANTDICERLADGKRWRRRLGQFAEACCVALFLVLTFAPLIYYACSYSDNARGPDKIDNLTYTERSLIHEPWSWNTVGAVLLSKRTRY